MISFGILVEYDQKKKVNSNVNKLIVKILLWWRLLKKGDQLNSGYFLNFGDRKKKKNEL